MASSEPKYIITESIPDRVDTHSNTLGTKRYHRDLMVCFSDQEGVIDVFLTNEQVMELHAMLEGYLSSLNLSEVL